MVLEDLHRCLLIHKLTTGPRSQSALSHAAMSHDRGEPLVNETDRYGRDTRRQHLGVLPCAADRLTLLTGELTRQTDDNLDSVPVPNDVGKLVDVLVTTT